MDSLTYFLDSLTDILDFPSSSIDNHIIMGDFSAKPLDSVMKDFIKVNDLVNLMKGNTCFKGHGSYIELTL